MAADGFWGPTAGKRLVSIGNLQFGNIEDEMKSMRETGALRGWKKGIGSIHVRYLRWYSLTKIP